MKRILAMLLIVLLVCLPALAEYKIYVTEEAKREMKKYSTLEKGDKGTKVKNMQYRLAELGYLDYADVDGVYGGGTKNAVYAFQINNWLTGSDGTAYPYTQYKLFDQCVNPAWGASMRGTCIGCYGDDVLWLEKRLCDTGYLDEDEVDGYFGYDTVDAVTMFQMMNDLYPLDGVVNAEEIQLIFSSNMNSYMK